MTSRPGGDDRSWGFRIRAVHAGNRPDPTTVARAVPIYQTTSFVFEDAADAADLFALQKYGNIYTRLKIEHARSAGGLHFAGFDTGVISARRTL